jgi:hypothetical protein
MKNSLVSDVGYTQAFGSFGGLMVTGAYYLIVTHEASFPLLRGEQVAWRYTIMSGIIPHTRAHYRRGRDLVKPKGLTPTRAACTRRASIERAHAGSCWFDSASDMRLSCCFGSFRSVFCTRGHKKGHTLIESFVSVRSERP